jgi:hypothetical protein
MIFGINYVRGKGHSEEMMPSVVLTRKLLGLCMEIMAKEKWKVPAEGHRNETKHNRHIM